MTICALDPRNRHAWIDYKRLVSHDDIDNPGPSKFSRSTMFTLRFIGGIAATLVLLTSLSLLVEATYLSRETTTIQPRIVDTGYALYRGNLTGSFSLAFLGVPYAEPPIGNLRFRAPVPLDTAKLKSNKRLFDARSYPDFCVQGTTGAGDAGGAGTEDCLKVNIYTPVNATAHSNCRSKMNHLTSIVD